MVGASFLGKTVVYAQQISDNGVPVIEMVGDTTLSTRWDISNLHQTQFRHEMESLFETIKNDLHFPDREISVVLPFEWLHCYTLQIDSALSEDDQREYLCWEFQQRLGDHHNRYRPHFYPVTTADHETVLTVGLPENLVSILKSAADTVHLELNLLELSPLSALSNIPATDATGCLCKFYEEVIEMTAYEHRKFVTSALFSLEEDNVIHLDRSSGGESETNELQSVLSDLFTGESSDVPVFVYGREIPGSIQKLIQEMENLQYIRSFQDIQVNFRTSETPDIPTESQYAEVMGTIRQALGDSA